MALVPEWALRTCVATPLYERLELLVNSIPIPVAPISIEDDSIALALPADYVFSSSIFHYAAVGAERSSTIAGVAHRALKCPANTSAGTPGNQFHNQRFTNFARATKASTIRVSLGRFVRGIAFKRKRAAPQPRRTTLTNL